MKASCSLQWTFCGVFVLLKLFSSLMSTRWEIVSLKRRKNLLKITISFFKIFLHANFSANLKLFAKIQKSKKKQGSTISWHCPFKRGCWEKSSHFFLTLSQGWVWFCWHHREFHGHTAERGEFFVRLKLGVFLETQSFREKKTQVCQSVKCDKIQVLGKVKVVKTTKVQNLSSGFYSRNRTKYWIQFNKIWSFELKRLNSYGIQTSESSSWFNKVLVGRRQTDKVLLEALNLITFPKEVDNFIKFPF